MKAGYDHTISTAVQEITLLEEERKELVEKLTVVQQEDQVFAERLVRGAFCTALHCVLIRYMQSDIRKRRDAIRDAQASRARLTGKLGNEFVLTIIGCM